MSSELLPLFVSGIVYLLVLSLIAHFADQGQFPERWINNPWVYTLSLGVYATSWSFYGSVGFAQSHGYQFIAIYIGATLAFVLSPVLLRPILRLTQEHQLSSLADLFAYRYRSQLAGVLVTLFMLVGTLPYIALQIRAISESLHVLTQELPSEMIALGYCLLIIFFSILFGAKHISSREKHHGLVAAIAFESLIKLIAISVVALVTLFGLFAGPGGLNQWLQQHPEAITTLYQPIQQGPWATLLFLAFAAAFLLPRQFHMLFSENLNRNHLNTASWAFPLFLLLFNLSIPILLWGGERLQLTIPADYYILGIALQSEIEWLPGLTFIGGLSAASSMIIVTSLALTSMCMNHLLLPVNYPAPTVNLYQWLLWGRRALVVLIIFAGYLFYTFLQHNEGLVQLGLISFVAVTQFIPGIIGLLYWREATRLGLITGLIGGILIWFVVLILPLLEHSSLIAAGSPQSGLYGEMEPWEFATLLSLLVNGTLFLLVSLFTRQSDAEQESAHTCCTDSFFPRQGVVSATSPAEFREALAASLGEQTATREVEQAMQELGLSSGESRPSELRRLRERLEQNLSGLIGPQMSHVIINQRLHLDTEGKTALADSIHYMEERLESSNTQLMGLNAELDELRRMQRQILQQLPIGVCVLDGEKHIVIWNNMMTTLSRIPADDARQQSLYHLCDPWRSLFVQLLNTSENHLYRIHAEIDERESWFNLHRSHYQEPYRKQQQSDQGTVILIEDVTELKQLESELAHSDRLASIGRLAAGVAHEIGNPVTGISCVVQNLQHLSSDAESSRAYEDILTQTERINRILKALTNFSRSDFQMQRHERFPLHPVILSSIHLAELTYKQAGIRFETDCDESLELIGDPQAITQVLINLLSNAADASSSGSSVEISATRQPQQVRIHVKDCGSGIPQQIHDRLFDPFFTTKAVGEGTGLGLSIAHRIIEEHGGSISIDSEPGRGTTVTITLPATH
jgi:Na+/proline symporter/signal transduction histidine kinase